MGFEAMRRLLALGVSACLLLVAGCGGGGGGSEGGGGGFRVSLSRTSVQLTLAEGEYPPASASLSATWTGQPPGNVYIGAVVEGDGIDPTIPITLSSTRADIVLNARSGLAAGRYTGRVLALVCADQACSQPVGGTPIPIAYTVVVTPGLRATPAAVALSAVSGQATGATLAVQLPPGEAAFQATLDAPTPWLELGAQTSTSLQVSARSWRAGTYTAQIRIASGGRVVNVPVSYTVAAPPGGEHELALTPGSLTISTVENAAASVRSVAVTPASWDPAGPVVSVRYAGAASGWLTTTRTATGFDVVANALGMTQGVYTATLTFTPAAPGTPLDVPVSMTVGPGLVAPAGTVHVVGAETALATLVGTVPVQLAGGPPIAWTASATANGWLRLTTASGTTGASLAYAIDGAGLQGLDNFADHTGTITISPALPNVTPVSFTVTLRKRLPEVTSIGPSLGLSGRTQRLVVRGRGFDSVADLSARLRSAGLPVTGVTRVSDTALTLQATPPDSLDRRLSFSNALGFDAAGATLRVIAPQTYPYAAIPSEGTKRAIVLDAHRRTVFAVNVGSNRLNRFRFDGTSSWTADHLNIANILDAGLSPDGQSLLVTSTPGALLLLDAESLSMRFSMNHAGQFPRNLLAVSPGIVSTNNGRSWLPVGDGGWNGLAYFDHATRTVQPSQVLGDGPTSYYGGPWAYASRNGERLLVVQSAGLSPAPLMLQANASDSLLRPNDQGLTFTYDAPMSDDGNVVLMDTAEVRNGSLALIGRTTIPSPSGFFGVAGAVSPDGLRAYVLAYHNTAIGTFPSAMLPKLYAFDTTSVTNGELALVGEIDVAHYPTCRSGTYECSVRARTAISPDGRTLFFVGDAHLVVQPLPTNLQSPAAATRANAAGVSPRTPSMQRWDLVDVAR